MIEDEPKANKVVGLKYRPGDGVPSVILKGIGGNAEQILSEANALTKPPVVVRNKELVEQLYRLPTDASITPELYELVALVMAHVFSIDDGSIQKKDRQ